MAPPPSQKGIFKPRKPAKKIRPGATTSSSTAPGDGTTTTAASTSNNAPTVAFAPADGSSASGGTERDTSRAGRGSGRGGRGRGRGRAPIPSGRVFFSGSTESKSSTGKRRSSNSGPASSSAAAGSRSKAASSDKSSSESSSRPKDRETTEEVVGQLDTAIGSTADKKPAASQGKASTSSAFDYEDEAQDGIVSSHKEAFTLDNYMYDSDSSREDETTNPGRSTQGNHKSIQPLELPFPSTPLPLGVGCTSRPMAYDNAPTSTSVTNTEAGGTVHQELPEPAMSPFVDAQNHENLLWEHNSWFLVQLPTRLPPLLPKTVDGPVPVLSSDDPRGGDGTNGSENNQEIALSDVVTPPVATKSHDNILTKTAPGRIGKIVVYKSGRTVLKMEGPYGTEPIVMDVSEGLSCGFRQEAVVIDQETSKYVALGDVSKSIVVTPDLSSASTMIA